MDRTTILGNDAKLIFIRRKHARTCFLAIYENWATNIGMTEQRGKAMIFLDKDAKIALIKALADSL